MERGFNEIDQPAVALAGVALAALGLKKRGLTGLFFAGIGSGLLFQFLRQNQFVGEGQTRRLLNTKASRSAEVQASLTIDRPIDEVWDQWRELERLPQFMSHIERVEPLGNGLWRWYARMPRTHREFYWDARIIEEVPHERLVWRSVEGSEVHNQGVVEFRKGPHGGQTEVVAKIEYRAPAGKLGAKVLDFLHAIPKQVVKEDIRNFKHVVETGEVPTIEGQPSGRHDSRSLTH